MRKRFTLIACALAACLTGLGCSSGEVSEGSVEEWGKAKEGAPAPPTTDSREDR